MRHQLMTTKKRRKVGIDLYIFQDEAEETSGAHDVDSYLAMLYTYLLALTIAGSHEVQSVHAEEAFVSDSTKFAKPLGLQALSKVPVVCKCPRARGSKLRKYKSNFSC